MVEDLNAQFARWRDDSAHQRLHPVSPNVKRTRRDLE